MKISFAAALALATALTPALAHDGPHAADHAPIGVMADHRHKQGEFMVSYRFMHMNMDGNRDGTDSLSAETIATTVPNAFAGQPMQPPTLRVVPLDMTMDMHMVGAMYGLTDRVTLVGMANYLTSEMDHVTFQGGMGNTELGNFTTETMGFGDTVIAAIIGLDDGAKPERQMNVNVGISLPTGSIEETDQILTPMGGTPTPRLPYPMQLGSGTYDLRPGFTYRDREGSITWGGQLSGIVRLGENDKGYTLGNRAELTGWLGYAPAPAAAGFLRLRAVSQGQIDGQDPVIVAPVQTADPNNHGGETVEVLFGLNLAGQMGALKGHRVAAEVGLPLYRDLNGPQLETDLTFTLGWQYAF
ncbi:MAG: transporter [Parvularculaceae bacterium]|nr:transporter [Parvularculaceae bacterium]